MVHGTKSGRTIVAVNMHPPSSNRKPGFWTGDGAVLLANAILYSVGALAPGESLNHVVGPGTGAYQRQRLEACLAWIAAVRSV